MITLRTELTPRGIEVTHPALGKVGTIERREEGWFVFPYTFAPFDYGATWRSLRAAEAHMLAIAEEMAELGITSARALADAEARMGGGK